MLVMQGIKSARSLASWMTLWAALILAPAGSGAWAAPVETVLRAFKGGSDGAFPSSLVSDSKGNLYGTTSSTVFKLAPSGILTVLHTFTGGSDGARPSGSLVSDSAGNLYCTTREGGLSQCQEFGCDVVFKLSPSGSFKVLHAFKGNDGVSPDSNNLIIDTKGSLYGATHIGGNLSACGGKGCGVVYKISPGGVFTLLHAFNGSDGKSPGNLVL